MNRKRLAPIVSILIIVYVACGIQLDVPSLVEVDKSEQAVLFQSVSVFTATHRGLLEMSMSSFEMVG